MLLQFQGFKLSYSVFYLLKIRLLDTSVLPLFLLLYDVCLFVQYLIHYVTQSLLFLVYIYRLLGMMNGFLLSALWFREFTAC